MSREDGIAADEVRRDVGDRFTAEEARDIAPIEQQKYLIANDKPLAVDVNGLPVVIYSAFDINDTTMAVVGRWQDYFYGPEVVHLNEVWHPLVIKWEYPKDLIEAAKELLEEAGDHVFDKKWIVKQGDWLERGYEVYGSRLEVVDPDENQPGFPGGRSVVEDHIKEMLEDRWNDGFIHVGGATTFSSDDPLNFTLQTRYGEFRVMAGSKKGTSGWHWLSGVTNFFAPGTWSALPPVPEQLINHLLQPAVAKDEG